MKNRFDDVGMSIHDVRHDLALRFAYWAHAVSENSREWIINSVRVEHELWQSRHLGLSAA